MEAITFASAIINAVDLDRLPAERLKRTFVVDTAENGKVLVKLKINKLKEKKPKEKKIDISEWFALFSIYHG